MKAIIVLLIMFYAASAADSNAVLRDIYITSSKKALNIEFHFESAQLPKFFQKLNSHENTWVVGFLMASFDRNEGPVAAPKDFPVFEEVEILTTRRKGKNGVRPFLEFHFQLSESQGKPSFSFKKSESRQIQFVWNEKFSRLSSWKLSAEKTPGAPALAEEKKEVIIKEAQEEPPLEEVIGTKSAFEMGAKIDSNKENDKSTFSPIPKPKSMTVLGEEANIYRKNTVKSERLKTAEIGDVYEQIKETSVFSGILWEGDTAYIKKSKIKPSDQLTDADKKKIKSFKEKMAEANLKKEKEKLEKLEKERLKKIAEEQKILEAKRQEEEEQKRLAEQEKKKQKEAARLEKEKEIALKKQMEMQEKEKRKQEEKIRMKQEAQQRQAELVRMEQENQMALMLAQQQREQELKLEQDNLKSQIIMYSSFGRRDPFIPVVQSKINEGDFNIDQMQLVGIIWDSKDPLAVLEHRMEPGISITLRSGDKISNGKVTDISHEKVTFEILEFGVYRNYTLKLTQKEK